MRHKGRHTAVAPGLSKTPARQLWVAEWRLCGCKSQSAAEWDLGRKSVTVFVVVVMVVTFGTAWAVSLGTEVTDTDVPDLGVPMPSRLGRPSKRDTHLFIATNLDLHIALFLIFNFASCPTRPFPFSAAAAAAGQRLVL